jgi:hypothetical protein
MRTQATKHLEHYFATGRNPKEGRGAAITARNQPPSTAISPARIHELRTETAEVVEPRVRP